MLARNVGKNTHAPAPFAPGLKKDTGAGLTMAMERGAGTAGYFDVMYCELVGRYLAKSILSSYPDCLDFLRRHESSLSPKTSKCGNC